MSKNNLALKAVRSKISYSTWFINKAHSVLQQMKTLIVKLLMFIIGLLVGSFSMS